MYTWLYRILLTTILAGYTISFFQFFLWLNYYEFGEFIGWIFVLVALLVLIFLLPMIILFFFFDGRFKTRAGLKDIGLIISIFAAIYFVEKLEFRNIFQPKAIVKAHFYAKEASLTLWLKEDNSFLIHRESMMGSPPPIAGIWKKKTDSIELKYTKPDPDGFAWSEKVLLKDKFIIGIDPRGFYDSLVIVP